MTFVIQTYYTCTVEDSYDGVPISELTIDAVDWEHRGEYIRTRSKRRQGEFDVEPEWATEAVVDPSAVIRRDPASLSGQGIRITGFYTSADSVLTVILIPKEHPPRSAWWGVNSWAANARDKREYWEIDEMAEMDEPEETEELGETEQP